MIEVETLEGSVRVTIQQEEVSQTQLEEMLGWLRLASAARRSALSEAKTEAMAEAAKAEWWAQNKVRFVPGNQP